MNVHELMECNAEMAYALTQTQDSIKDGDVLIVPDLHVVGVLVEAWPIAVTENKGSFEGLAPGYDLNTLENGKYRTAAIKARVIAQERFWPVCLSS